MQDILCGRLILHELKIASLTKKFERTVLYKVKKEKLYLGEVEEDGGNTKNNSLLLVW